MQDSLFSQFIILSCLLSYNMTNVFDCLMFGRVASRGFEQVK